MTQICFQCFKQCLIIGELFYTNITKDNPLTRYHACAIISVKHHFTTIIFLWQTCFVNNPISGAVILVAFFIADWEVGIGTILGGSVATLIEMVREYNLNQSKIFSSLWQYQMKSMIQTSIIFNNIEFQNSSFDYILGIWCETVSLHSTVAYLAPSQRHFFQSFSEKSVLLFFGHLLLEEGL